MLDRLQEDMKNAMRSGDRNKLSVLRMLISEFKNERIRTGKDLSEKESIGLVKSALKKRKDSAKMYRDGNRPDLAEKEELEIAVIEQYLPEQLSMEETEKIVSEIVAETGASGMKDMGKVMGLFMAKYRAVADGNIVQEVVKRKLS